MSHETLLKSIRDLYLDRVTYTESLLSEGGKPRFSDRIFGKSLVPTQVQKILGIKVTQQGL